MADGASVCEGPVYWSFVSSALMSAAAGEYDAVMLLVKVGVSVGVTFGVCSAAAFGVGYMVMSEVLV